MENLYLVCLIPPSTIVEDIDEIRKNISNQFNVYESLRRPAHITLYPPVKLTSKDQEQRFFNALDEAAWSSDFIQVLSHFGGFPQHTFYLNVAQNTGLMNLELQIREALKPLKLLDKQNSQKFNPHLTLAFRDVKPPIFEAITTYFKDRKFKREFLATGFSVYKHNDKRWQPYKEIAFKPPGDRPKQADLFSGLIS